MIGDDGIMVFFPLHVSRADKAIVLETMTGCHMNHIFELLSTMNPESVVPLQDIREVRAYALGICYNSI